ncbi:hypothetical protein HCN44_003746 [Aphidius gifuensis]|uniref:RNA polymerase I-specific transcription initiation factor RRN3 n=1 Tax=Aphidius gifuensis TaxID=684658 RepID=A0A834XIS0_APHGI|nr:RNA polymerase I-specific transcription initiation factor RRN3-like [Aphidius gifuensis]KAF7987883.1 hypothetical protein HCN44_003746 [Aphidius gifuensis]
MSVTSSKSAANSVSSILNKTGLRTKLIAQRNRVSFQLPNNLEQILLTTGDTTANKAYHNLLCILKDAVIKDHELLLLLDEFRQCIPHLNTFHSIIIEALLAIDWIERPPDVITAYKIFFEDLISVHVGHCKLAIDKLVLYLKPLTPDDKEWPDCEPTEKDKQRLENIHDIFRKLLKMVPMSNNLLFQALSSSFPYMKASTHAHEIYINSLLKVTEYAPELRSEILSLIINKLLILDVHAPRALLTKEDEDDDDEIFEIDQLNDKNKKIHPIGHTLDICMKIMLKYIKQFCHNKDDVNDVIDKDKATIIYYEFLHIFDKLILPTFASHHIQFIMFFISSLNGGLLDGFLTYLWQKVINVNVAPVLRKSAVSYIASLLARGNFITIIIMKKIIFDLSDWINKYIEIYDNKQDLSIDPKIHTVFYSTCQALFYIIAFRCKDFIGNKQHITFLDNLKLNKIISSKLNPLKYCLTTVVDIFSKVSNNLQIAYCSSIIERNSRTNLPVIHNQHCFETLLETFFPFDAYVLQESSQLILPLYKAYESIFNDKESDDDDEDDDEEDDDEEKEEENDVDDFIMDCSSPKDKGSWNARDKLLCSTSPGFFN